MFQLMFAVITPALISGAVADRLKFWSWTLFVALWVTLVYFPVAHWVFSFGGFVSETAVGGWIANANKSARWTSPVAPRCTSTPVRRASRSRSCSASAAAGRRSRCGRTTCRSCMLGAGLLWFGWFGFNAGSALAAAASRPSPSSTR